MKAIILTYAPVTKQEHEILVNTKIFKLALNQHAEYLHPDVRICSDFNLSSICRNFSQPVISIRDGFRFKSKRVLHNHDIEFKGATVICAVEWLIAEKYNDILIIGDNSVNTKEFQDNVNKQVAPLMEYAAIWQYRHGYFQLPVKSVEGFIND